MIDNSLFYNPNKMLSYNRILSFVIGARGLGKTYGMKKYVINRFIKTGEQFIYLKRYRSDIKGINQFFDSIASEFPEATFKVKGHELYINDDLAGWVMALSSWQSIKSREFPNVTTIIYDEFLLEKSSKQQYMSKEPTALLNFMDTVIRNRDNARCICLSNAVSLVNPYFIYFGITPDEDKRYNAYKNILVEIPDSINFADARKQTAFGELISETEYGSFSLGNEFVNDSVVFIEKRSSEAKYKFSVLFGGLEMGVWVDVKRGVMYISQDHDPDGKFKYAMTKDDANEEYMLVFNWKKNFHISRMVNAFLNGLLRFDGQVVRNISYDMFRKMNIK